jgi:hypothetical protein
VLYIDPNPNGLTAEKFYDRPNSYFVNMKNITVGDGIPALGLMNCTEMTKSCYSIAIKGAFIEFVNLMLEQNVMNQILSTFKFTSPQAQNKALFTHKQPISCNEDWNFDKPTEQVGYTDKAKGIEFAVPYNPKWASTNYRLEPYEVDGDDVYFGNLSGGEGCGLGRGYYMHYDELKSSQQIIDDLKQDQNYLFFKDNPILMKPRVVDVNGLQVVEYLYNNAGLCSEPTYIIVGKKFNYVFTNECTADIWPDTLLEKVIKTVKLID